jgi:hypothetical protein
LGPATICTLDSLGAGEAVGDGLAVPVALTAADCPAVMLGPALDVLAGAQPATSPNDTTAAKRTIPLCLAITNDPPSSFDDPTET